MAHRFDGTWSYYKIAERGFNPNPPTQAGDFALVIDDLGRVDNRRSTVDGRAVQSGTATATTLEITAVGGRKYFGHFIKEIILGSQSTLVLAGRHRGPAESPKAKGKQPRTSVQDEGTWVLTKP